jgi:ATP-dependent Clp protease adaptor protein ClpS
MEALAVDRTLGAAAPRFEEKEASDVGSGGEPWKTVLFNCECHSFEDVEKILIKATSCSLSRARQLSWEIHSRGNAVVHEGPRERCEDVADVIASIGLRVETVR